jgi:hypothetical protein
MFDSSGAASFLKEVSLSAAKLYDDHLNYRAQDTTLDLKKLCFVILTPFKVSLK